MNEQRKNQIHEYLRVHFRTIRDFFNNEPEYQPYVPDLFRSAYVFQVFECTDGYVVAAYLSGLADNYIYNDSNNSVANQIERLPNLIAGTQNHVVLHLEGLGGNVLLAFVLDCVKTDRGVVPTTGWKLLFVATKAFSWPPDDAKESARQHIAEFKARAAVYKPAQGPFLKSYNKALERQQITGQLHEILKEYRSIVSEEKYRERVIHRFLRDHPVMFFPTKRRMFYEYALQENSKTQYVMDFVVEVTTGRYILVELENPKHNIFKANGDFSQPVNHAENQVQDWMLWIRQHYSIIERELPGIVAPEGLIVIGRGGGLSSLEKDKICMRNEKHNIRLTTYDDLAEEAENHIRHILEA